MKYVVTRSSCWGDEDPQCPGSAVEMVSRDKKLEAAYTVEIGSLEELHQLSKKVGNSIIVKPNAGWDFDIPELEIYDAYRE